MTNKKKGTAQTVPSNQTKNPNNNIENCLQNQAKNFPLTKLQPPKKTEPSPPEFCISCEKPLKNEPQFSQLIAVCSECLKIYWRIDSALNAHAERRARDARFQRFAIRFGGVK